MADRLLAPSQVCSKPRPPPERTWSSAQAVAHLVTWKLAPVPCVSCFWASGLHSAVVSSTFQTQLGHHLLLSPRHPDLWPVPLLALSHCAFSLHQGSLPTGCRCPFFLSEFPGIRRLISDKDEGSREMAAGGLWQPLVAGALSLSPLRPACGLFCLMRSQVPGAGLEGVGSPPLPRTKA